MYVASKNFCTCKKVLLNNHIPVLGHSKHCPDEAYDTEDNSKQHCSKDIK